jgi:hypothetical protein
MELMLAEAGGVSRSDRCNPGGEGEHVPRLRKPPSHRLSNSGPVYFKKGDAIQ